MRRVEVQDQSRNDAFCFVVYVYALLMVIDKVSFLLNLGMGRSAWRLFDEWVIAAEHIDMYVAGIQILRIVLEVLW